MANADRKKMAAFLRERARDCYSEAGKDLAEARKRLSEPMGDGERIEGAICAALLTVGEARGFVNAASDIEEGDDNG